MTAGNIKEIVNVNITRQTGAVTRAGFGTLLFMDRGYFFTDRVQEFSSLTAVTDAGFTTDSATYKAAAVYFGQNVKPEKLKVGLQTPTTIVLTPSVGFTTGDVFSVYIGHETQTPKLFTYTVGGGDTATDIVTALQAAIEADPDVNGEVVATIPGDTLTLAAETSVKIIVNNWTANWTISYTSSETVVEAIIAIQAEDNDWYALSTYDHTAASVTAIAAHIEAQEPKKIYGFSSSSADNTSSSATGVMSDLKTSAYSRTFGIQDAEAGTDDFGEGYDDSVPSTREYPEAAFFGRQLPTDPGSTTWMFKTLAGISEDGMTSTEATNVLNKNGNTYQQFLGTNMMRNGTMADGTFIDLVRGSDWLEARIAERVYRLLINTPKIPYTSEGVAMIENEIRAQVDEGIRLGFLVSNSLTITVPVISEVNPNDKALRILPAIEFSVQAQGALHKIVINGTVTI